MDKFRFTEYRRLVVFTIAVVIIMAETISSRRYGRQKTGRELGLDIKAKVTTTSTVSKLDVLRGLDLKKGDSHDGVSSIKLYLATFGYLLHQEQEQHAWDDLFDEQLEEGLRLYQNNFNLRVTGFLDQETLGTMRIPRCSREDIPNELLMLLFKAPSKGSIWNQELWKLPIGNHKWKSTHDLTYAISSTIARAESTILSKEDIRKALASAFDSWAAVIPLNFSETNQFEEANIKIEFVARDHGDGVPFDGPIATVAHAFGPEDGRLHFNVDESWTTSCHITHHPSAIDVESTAVHEIGHVIGLGHSKIEDSVMYPTLESGYIRHALTEDDIRAARALYGARIFNHQDQDNDQQKEEKIQDRPSHIQLLVVGLLMLAVCLRIISRRLPCYI